MIDLTMPMKEPLLAIFVAVGAKPMDRLASGLVWVEDAHHCRITNIAKRISGALLLPLVVVSKLLLEGYVGLPDRLIVLRYHKMLLVQLKDSMTEFNFKPRPFGVVTCLQKSLRYCG